MNFVDNLLGVFFNIFTNSNGLPFWQSLIVSVLLLILFLLLTKSKNFFEKLIHRRSCGDCVLLIFGISEEYRSQEDYINRNLLNKKMLYAEQKIELVILNLLKQYKVFQKNNPNEKEYWGYKHSITNALDLVKREIRRTFLENGFHTISGKEFSDYVKEKTKSLISTIENFIMNDYPKDMTVQIETLFSSFDKNWFEDIIFEIYINSKSIQVEADNNIDELEKQLKEDIDIFVKRKK